MELVIPTIEYKRSYLHAVDEGKNETGVTIIRKPHKGQSFEKFIKNVIEEAKGLHLPKGWVPATELWLIDNDEFIGWVNIRHSLTAHLHRVGGHIGYWIRPSKRNMGYGKKILKLSLIKSRELGIKKILITCDDTNVSSRKIIEKNGGVLENIVDNGVDNPKKRRYWITIPRESKLEGY